MLSNPFYPMNNSYTTVTEASLYGVSGDRQPVQAGHAHRHEAELRSVPGGPVRLQPGPEQLRPERRRRVAAAGDGAGSRAAAVRLAGRRQRDPRRRRDGVPAAGHVGLHRRLRRQPGHLGEPDARFHERRRLAADPAAQRQPGGAAGGAGGDLPDLPDGGHQQRQHVRREPAEPVHAVVHDRLAAQAGPGHGVRAALRRQPSSSGLGDGEPERDQHHRQRVRERVPEGAGEPAGQHRGRQGRDVRLHRRRHLAAADLPGVLQRPEQHAGRRRHEVRGRQLDQRDVPRLPGGAEPEPARVHVQQRRRAARPRR